MDKYTVLAGSLIYGAMLLSFYSFFIRSFIHSRRSEKSKRTQSLPAKRFPF